MTEAFVLATGHHQAGRFAEAEQLYRQILAVAPEHAEALHRLGILAHQSGHYGGAAELMGRSLEIEPGAPAVLNNLGEALRAQKCFEEAVAAFRKALVLQPDYPQAENNLGCALAEQGRREEAVDAYQRALALRPDQAETWANLGNIQFDLLRLDEAAAAYSRALELDPGRGEVMGNLARVLREQGRPGEASEMYRRAVELQPDSATLHSGPLYHSWFDPGAGPGAILEAHREWDRRHAQGFKREWREHGNARDPERRLRVGYVSPDFCEHPVGRHLLVVLPRHDRREVEVFGYYQAGRPDALTARLLAACDVARDIEGVSDERLDAMIREDGIDVLVDCSLHMRGNRLLVFARRPAPVQVTFFGYPGTTGLEAMDYRLGDRWLDPEDSDGFYSEETVRLPDSFWVCEFEGEGGEVGDLPALREGFVTFGCLNNFAKVNDAVLCLWAEVLAAVPGSRLLLLGDPGSHCERTRAFLRERGVESGRVEFAARRPRAQFLALHHQVDVALDTFPYNGHMTSLDALWMGVPVVSLSGRTVVSRGALSLLANLGLESRLVACEGGEYVQKAVALAKDLPGLWALRRELRQRLERSPLMDGARFVRGMEAAYRQMWRRWCAGQSAQNLPGAGAASTGGSPP